MNMSQANKEDVVRSILSEDQKKSRNFRWFKRDLLKQNYRFNQFEEVKMKEWSDAVFKANGYKE